MKTNILFFFIIILYSCAPSRFVKPLDKKQQAVNLSLGGPLIAYQNFALPAPFITACYGYGIDSTLTGFGSLNISSGIYGNLQLEVGAVKRLLQQKGFLPAISITPVVNFIYRNKEAKKFYPQLDANAYWDYNKGKNFVYIGIANLFELSPKKAFDVKQPHRWFFSPMVGQTFVKHKYNFTIEAKVIAPHISYESSAAEYASPFGKHGAFGIYFGYTRKF